MILGATLDLVHAAAPPVGEDTEYLAETEAIRVLIRQHDEQVQALLREAERMMGWAAREMWRAIRERNWPRYYMALEAWLDARCAASICHETQSVLHRADRELALAPWRYADVYKGPVTFAARGGLLPHDGQWIIAR